MTKRRKRDDAVARMARQEHEDREDTRHRLKRLRGHTQAPAVPRSIRAHRSADKNAPLAPPPAPTEPGQ